MNEREHIDLVLQRIVRVIGLALTACFGVIMGFLLQKLIGNLPQLLFTKVSAVAAVSAFTILVIWRAVRTARGHLDHCDVSGVLLFLSIIVGLDAILVSLVYTRMAPTDVGWRWWNRIFTATFFLCAWITTRRELRST